MATGAQIQAKIQAKLAALNATPRVVSFRTMTRTGGNPRLGIGGTVTYTDTVADPQPAAELVKAEDIAGSGGLLQPGDWMFTFSGIIPEETFRTSSLLFGTEVLNIVQVSPYALNGIIVGWGVLARTATTR
jgi:hypothetical protein